MAQNGYIKLTDEEYYNPPASIELYHPEDAASWNSFVNLLHQRQHRWIQSSVYVPRKGWIIEIALNDNGDLIDAYYTHHYETYPGEYEEADGEYLSPVRVE